jgi:hypothetical protein
MIPIRDKLMSIKIIGKFFFNDSLFKEQGNQQALLSVIQMNSKFRYGSRLNGLTETGGRPFN